MRRRGTADTRKTSGFPGAPFPVSGTCRRHPASRNKRIGDMFRKLVLGLALAMPTVLPLANVAEAAVGDGVVASHAASQLLPIEHVQYVYGGQNYCWYDNGWRGPGYYYCGYAFRTGLGWGGGIGWNNWGGGGWRGGGGEGGCGDGGGGGWRGGGWRGGGCRGGGGGWHGGGGGFHGGGFHG